MITVNKPLKLGILGGLGPMASAYFLEMITEHTKASRDQDHIDILLSSRATTPDRTDFILGRSDEDPLPVMVEDAKYLESCNVSAIVIPCNTAHYFIDEIRDSVSVPVPSIIDETVAHVKRTGAVRPGIMATEGTLFTRSYQLACERAGIGCVEPDAPLLADVMTLIYDYVKKGRPVSRELFYRTVDAFRERDCDSIILGCTELSVINKSLGSDPALTDSLEVLAHKAIELCDGTPVGFNSTFDR